MSPCRAGAFLTVCAVASAVVAGQSGRPGARLEQVLRSRFGMTADQVAAVHQGRSVAVALPTRVDREIQVGGAVHVNADAARVADVLQDVERLESGEGFIRTRRISTPPRLEDFRDLELPAQDVAALRKCRPGSCDVKLGSGAFDQLARFDWTAPAAAARVNELARQMSLDYIEAYRRGGNAELAVYRDSGRPQFIAAEFADMVSRAGVWPDVLGPLNAYLLGYPAVPAPPGARDFFYWSLAEFGLKPVIRLNHVVVFPTGRSAGLQYVVAVKQLYASHYFHTALEIRAVVADDTVEPPGSTIVILNMARSDGLTGLFGGLVKSKARSASQRGLEGALTAIKRMAEAGGGATAR